MAFLHSKMHQKIKKYRILYHLANIFLLFFSVFLSLLFGEIALQLFWEPIPDRVDISTMNGLILPGYPDYLEFVSGRETVAVAKTCEYEARYQINSMGMRDREHDFTKHTDRTRILFVGDSYTEGVGVEQNETYPYLLQELSGGKYTCFNAGIRATCPSNAYFRIKKYIERINSIDAVVLQLFTNDIHDDRYFTDLYHVQYERDTKQIKRSSFSQSQHLFLRLMGPFAYSFRKTNLYLLLAKLKNVTQTNEPFSKSFDTKTADRVYELYMSDNILLERKTIDENTTELTFPITSKQTLSKTSNKELWKLAGKLAIKMNLDVVEKHAFDSRPLKTVRKNQNKYALSLNYLDGVLQLCKKNGITLFVYCIPVLINANNSWVEPYSSWCHENGIPMFFPAEALYEQAMNNNTPMYYVFDYHMTKEGHRVVAQQLQGFLSEHLEAN